MYVELSDIQGKIPPDFLLQALDDNGDGTIDAWEKVQADACEGVDQILGLRYGVPFVAPFPPIVPGAAKIFACEICYSRRGVMPDQNPWTKQADTMRANLGKIAAGTMPLAPTIKKQNPAGTLIHEPAATFDRAHRRLS